MLQNNSRYYAIQTTTYESADGHRISYVKRRFIPPAESLSLLTEVTVKDGDRLDLFAARTLGDAEQFWRIADANNAMNPPTLLTATGRVLHVAVPTVET